MNYNEYKEVIIQEEKSADLPIIYNVSFGHAISIGILSYGIQTEMDCDKKNIILLESATVEK